MKNIWVIYLQNFKQDKKKILQIMFFIIVGLIGTSITPYLYGKIIDFIVAGNTGKLMVVLTIYGTLFLISIVLGKLQLFWGQKLVLRIVNRVKDRLFHQVLIMKCIDSDSFLSGELINRIDGDAEEIVNYFLTILTSSITIVVNVIVSIWCVFNISWQLTLLSMGMFPLTYLINLLVRKKIQNMQKRIKKSRDDYFNNLEESLTNIQAIKIFREEKNVQTKFRNTLLENYKVNKENAKILGVVNGGRQGLDKLFEIIILYVAGILVVGNKLTIGMLITFNTYISRIYESVSDIMELNLEYNNILISLNRVKQLQQVEGEEKGRSIRINNIKSIEFQNVFAGYKNKNILKNLSFKISEPGLYSIVGENGSGKSTLLKVIAGLYEYNNGEICLNDMPMNKIVMNDIRGKIAYATKDTVLFSKSILENIRLAKSEGIRKDIIEACHKVGLMQYIDSLEQGVDTVLGEGGMDLSSGQKQRLNMARVLIKKADIILLDEITSDIDIVTKSNMIKLVKELAEHSIVINATHDTELLKKSKKIMWLHNGEIEELVSE